MQSSEFKSNLETLLNLASFQPTAIMCAEAVPWRCHRSLIADAATAKGYEVINVMGIDSLFCHQIRKFAIVTKNGIYYPGDPIENKLNQTKGN